MKELFSPLPAARSLALIAHEILIDTHNAAVTRVSDLRSQVEDLWDAAGEMMPRTNPAEIYRHLESAIEALKNRDTIGFPKGV